VIDGSAGQFAGRRRKTIETDFAGVLRIIQDVDEKPLAL